MKAVLTSPLTMISQRISSHRAAQGVIYADQLKQAGKDVTISMSADMCIKDYNEFDEMYIYHGNDWSGSLNLFGGVKESDGVHNFINFSKFKGKVYSLIIPFPDYRAQLMKRLHSVYEKDGKVDDCWNQVDWNNIINIEKNHEVLDPNTVKFYKKIATGDSHAISMYRPGWMVNSVPFKTLHGALKMGLEEFIKPYGTEFEEIEFYFGNIDVRHHFLRQDNPKESVKNIVEEYFKQAEMIVEKYNSKIKIYELLPIENESRKVPKSGWFKNTPFFGNQADRNDIRLYFKEECLKRVNDRISLFEWVDHMINSNNELDFKYMEKPQSVHLSREFYPHWQGKEWNQPVTAINSTRSLDSFI